jgi:hypothetical protein
MTLVVDTSHLDDTMRKLIAPVTAALGAIVCPRPPGLDTDADIVNPNEFNPPTSIADSQVSLGLNGEMMQSIFITLIVRPHQYAWAVGMSNYLIHKTVLSATFLRFVATEAARGLAANYRLQTADEPNYDCFEASEINLHALVKLIYKEGKSPLSPYYSCFFFLHQISNKPYCYYINRIKCSPICGTTTTGFNQRVFGGFGSE